MKSFKKSLLFLLFLCLSIHSWADIPEEICIDEINIANEISITDEIIVTDKINIIDKIIEENFKTLIQPFGSMRNIGSLYVDGNNLNISYESGFDSYPSIMAYNIEGNSISIILKCRPIRQFFLRQYETANSHYYLVNLFLNDNEEIEYNCFIIENPSLIIDGFIFNTGIIVSEYVNVRSNQSTQSRIVGRLYQNTKVEVISIGSRLTQVAQMLDFWMEIKLDGNNFWVYGYYIDFLRSIVLK